MTPHRRQGPPRSHLAPFLEGPRPWLVVLRNAIPVAGVHLLDWSSTVALFEIWFDGASALAAMIALHIRAFILTDPKARPPADIPAKVAFLGMLVAYPAIWLLLLLLLGFPYWLSLVFFGSVIFPPGFWSGLSGDPAILLALLYVFASKVAEEFRRGYERMNPEEIRLEFNWDFSMHLARIGMMMLVAFFFGRYLIAGLALALSYVEIYPMRTLRIVGGDRTLEPGNNNRSRD
ncbi:MAG: hypothetical protein K9J74_12120 [Sulfuritalea sp.]|nr:hypothetical protein [Sulfuritalea sp.]